MNDEYVKPTQKSVTCFLYCGDDYLFLERGMQKHVNPGKLNGVGGRVEKGEDYVSAAIREIEEETGYIVSVRDIEFCGMFIFEEGLPEHWVAAFFKVHVADKRIPIGQETKDGKLLWLHEDKVLDSGEKLLDDLYYCFNEIILGKKLFFITANTDGTGKILTHSKQLLKR